LAGVGVGVADPEPPPQPTSTAEAAIAADPVNRRRRVINGFTPCWVTGSWVLRTRGEEIPGCSTCCKAYGLHEKRAALCEVVRGRSDWAFRSHQSVRSGCSIVLPDGHAAESRPSRSGGRCG
jgi:hypothetical protein